MVQSTAHREPTHSCIKSICIERAFLYSGLKNIYSAMYQAAYRKGILKYAGSLLFDNAKHKSRINLSYAI